MSSWALGREGGRGVKREGVKEGGGQREKKRKERERKRKKINEIITGSIKRQQFHDNDMASLRHYLYHSFLLLSSF